MCKQTKNTALSQDVEDIAGPTWKHLAEGEFKCKWEPYLGTHQALSFFTFASVKVCFSQNLLCKLFINMLSCIWQMKLYFLKILQLLPILDQSLGNCLNLSEQEAAFPPLIISLQFHFTFEKSVLPTQSQCLQNTSKSGRQEKVLYVF